MQTSSQIIHAVRELLEVARHAPSVHNTQPWTFRLQDNTLEFLVEPSRMLHAGDPTTRQLWISLGCMLETLLQAADALGIGITVTSLQTNSLKKPIAALHISPAAHSSRDKEALASIQKRHTHRGPLANKAIEPSIVRKLSKITNQPHLRGAEVLTTSNIKHIELASKLTEQGLRLAFSSTAFRHELSHLIRPNWTHSHTGLPGFVLGKKAPGALWEKWSVWFNLESSKKATAEAYRVKTASLLLFIATPGDVPTHWFAAGRAYILTTLELTKQNLLHSTIAAPIEASDYHQEIEAMLGTKLRIQCMLIAGYPIEQKRHRPAPRLTVEELLTKE